MLTFWQWIRFVAILACFLGFTTMSIIADDVSGMIIFPTCLVVYLGAALVLWIQYRRDNRGN